MPFRNAEAFLKECIQSILSQTSVSWELIAINDHSEDQGPAILERFAQNHLSIRIVQNEGRGIIEALKTGYQKCVGKFITRMDADDIMAPNKLEVMTQQLEHAGTGNIATGLVQYFAENGINDGYKKYETWLNQLAITGGNFSELYKECVIPSPCFMVFREDMDRCGAFDSDRYPEDYDLAFRFFKAGLNCLPATEVLHHWRDYSSRTSRTDEHYADNRFLDLKLHYFLQLHYQPERPLVIWGAGTKGKNLAKKLLEREVQIHWVCDNPKKIGKDVYGVKMESFEALQEMANPQVIVVVAGPDDQKQVSTFLMDRNSKSMVDHFFFC